MKKHLLLLATLFGLVSAKSQTTVYHPFPDSNAVWNVSIQNPCLYFLDYCEQTYSYILDGDTLINGNTFHKITVPAIQLTAIGTTCSNCSGFQAGGDAGFIRQDIPNKKVYYIESGSNIEYLLYDFNLQVGDTVTGYLEEIVNCQPNYDIVSSIDSILIGNSYRKRWNLNPGDYEYLIEGIGITYGIGTYHNFLGQSDCGLIDIPPINLTCFSYNDTILYQPIPSYPCNLITTVKNISETNFTVNISPNPFHTTTRLQLNSDFAKGEMLLYNALGSLVMRQTITNQNSLTLNRDNLSNGLYFLYLTNYKGQMTVEKLIVD